MRHGGHTDEVPLEALLTPDPEMYLARGPLHEPGTSCRYGACVDDEVCDCQDEDEPWGET